MTDEEKIREVEAVLDGVDVAKALALVPYLVDDAFYYFLTDEDRDHGDQQFVQETLKRVFTEAEIAALWTKEQAKWDSWAQSNVEPEILEEWERWKRFMQKALVIRTPEEHAAWTAEIDEEISFPRGGTKEAVAEWVANRKDQTNRKEYAQKFYGAKPCR